MTTITGPVAAPRDRAPADARGHRLRAGLPYLPAVLSALVAALFAAMIPSVAAGNVLRLDLPWLPSLGITVSFLVDGLSLTFALLVSGIGALVFLYSTAYMAGSPRLGRLVVLLAAFEASMLGLVLANDMILLFVFWELTTVTSFLLIGFFHEDPSARAKALQGLLVTGAGGLALLAGLLLLQTAAGTFDIAALEPLAGTLTGDPLYPAILVLVLLGCFTKSAQFPFHFWLPNAMAAPTPVSAYLHSATMVKAGVYLLARLSPALGGTAAWLWSLTVVGAITAVLASVWALRQTDLKLMLAYTTVMALGTLTMFLGGASPYAIIAAATFLIVHALYKAALFLVVGIIDHETGTREIDAVGGLARAMPITFAATALAALSMAGFPPLLGFIGKELKYEGALAVASEPVLVTGAAVLANALMVAVAALVTVRPFLGERRTTPKAPHEGPWAMWSGPVLLAVLGLVLGLFPDLIGRTLVEPIAVAILGHEVTVELKLWHGVNVPLVLSIVTVALGAVFFWQAREIRYRLEDFELTWPAPAERGYDLFLDGLKRLAAWQTRVLQGGRLARYTLVTLGSLALGLGSAVLASGALAWPSIPPVAYVAVALAALGGLAFMITRSRLAGLVLLALAGLTGLGGAIAHDLFIQWAIVGLAALGAIATASTRSRLAAFCALGIVGIAVALIFVIYGAIDVAMTQLLVETLVIIIAAVALLKLPRLTDATAAFPASPRIGHAVLSAVLGVVVTLSLWAVLAGDLDRRVTAFYEAESAPAAFGRNIVNVILVDFRALDTLGEIAVVAVAALAAYGLLRLRPPADRGPDR